ncbi:MAG: TolC family protein, partial [Myxococcota bacterium]
GARLASARATLQSRKSAFAAGVGTYTEVLEAEADLSDARLSRLGALIDARLAGARLERAIGALATED